jgi:hypothetical protein
MSSHVKRSQMHRMGVDSMIIDWRDYPTLPQQNPVEQAIEAKVVSNRANSGRKFVNCFTDETLQRTD